MRDGGVLVAVADAAAWLCAEKVGLLATKPEKRGGPGKGQESAKRPEGGEGKPAGFGRGDGGIRLRALRDPGARSSRPRSRAP